MRLHVRLLIASALLALTVATISVMALQRLRAQDAAATIDRLMSSSMTHHTREACEGDPNWFLAGPRTTPPTKAERAEPDSETRLPRPSTDPLPIEFYAYDQQYEASTTAAPKFPPEFKAAMRATPPVKVMSGRFSTPEGDGVQMARMTGWSPGPCALLLFRLRPLPGQFSQGLQLFAGSFVMSFAICLVAAGPIVQRIRRLSRATRDSARQDYSATVPIAGDDEIGNLGAMFNEIGADIRRRVTDSKDREEALRRYVAEVTDCVAVPLADLESTLARGSVPNADVIRRAHELSGRLLNLEAVARLRTSRDRLTREPVDMNAVVGRVIASLSPIAQTMGVTIAPALPKTPAVIAGDPALFERAIANLVDNAILYNRPGGRIAIEIAQYDGKGRFSLRITDTGQGVSDDEFAGLIAIRRFRGDEGRERRPGVPGLGLAVAREVAERFGFGLELRRPAAGGFEVEFGGTGS